MANFYAQYPFVGAASSGGTVTSVGLTDASTTPIYAVTGSPVTNSGTLTLTLNTESANKVFAGPTSGGAAQPTFRALVTADLPSSGSGNLTDAGTDGITVTGGTGATLSNVSLSQHVADTTHNGYLSSTDWNTFNSKQPTITTGNLTDAGTDGITVTGGTGAVIGSGTSLAQHVADATHNGYLASADWNTFNGKQAAGNYITALTGDVTASGPGSVAATLAATTNATLTTISSLVSVGTLTTGTWHATAIDATHGGTAQTTYTAGDTLYASATNTISKLGIGSTGNVLTVSGGVPTWAPPATAGTVTSVAMTVPTFLSVSGSPVTSTGTLAVSLSGTALPVANGGTGQNSNLTQNGVVYGSTTTAMATTTAGTSGQVLTSNGGSSSAPTFQTVPGNTTVLKAPTVQTFLPAQTTGTTVGGLYRTFTVSSANATVGATYTNNSITYTVLYTIAGGTTLVTSQSTTGSLVGTTLTKASGTGDATITLSSSVATGQYQLPSNPAPLYIVVEVVAGGGGGAGTGTSPGAAGAGSNANFGSTLLVANGGGAASATISGVGGTASVAASSTVLQLQVVPGSPGSVSSLYYPGGNGGSSFFGGGAGAGAANGTGNGSVGGTNTGGGGGGASAVTGSTAGAGGGGGGGYAKAIITSPASTYTFAIGDAGAGGNAGGSGAAGGKGGIGGIWVTEHYQ